MALDTDLSQQLNLDDLHSATGKGARVLVIDSGVEVSHPQFAGRPIKTWQVQTNEHPADGQDIISVEPDNGSDVFGHGTAVASIIAQYAPDAQIDSVRALGGDLRCTSDQILAALNWGFAQNYDVINCSFGSANEEFLPDYFRAVNSSFCRNSILVAASNNMDYMQIEYPGSFPSVISTDFGPLEKLQLQRRSGKLVEFVASGEELRCAWKDGQYRVNTGSSFAAPHLAALAARIRQLRPNWNACQVKSFLYLMAENVE
jgi:subtilisin family serine protease